MELSQALIDVLRAAHLLFFAAGMGAALYFDFEKFRTLQKPLSEADVWNFTWLHHWISYALGGLWATGIILIYVRTNFVIAEVSPKLRLKVGLMSFMVLNAWLIGRFVLPSLKANVGRSIASFSAIQFVVFGQIGILSMFLWTSGLVLGSSVVVRTASWDILLPLILCWCLVLTICGQTALLFIRQKHLKRDESDTMVDRDNVRSR